MLPQVNKIKNNVGLWYPQWLLFSLEIQLVNKFGGDGLQLFVANRPFLFFIEDEKLGTLLFAGKVEDPTK